MLTNIKSAAFKCYSQPSVSDADSQPEERPKDKSRATATAQARKALVTAMTIAALERATQESLTGAHASRAIENKPAPRLHASLTRVSNAFRLSTRIPKSEGTYAEGIGLLSLASLSRLPNLVASGATVVFDLDQTLVDRKGSGDARWLELTQPDAADVVQHLQRRDDIHVLGLTARPYQRGGRDIALKTEKELRKLGIDFLTPKTAQLRPDVRGTSKEVGFRAGCGYTGATIAKGDLLMRLHEQAPMTKLIFVDDLPSNLHTVAEFAVIVGIPCLAVHYTGAIDKRLIVQQQAAWDTLCSDWCQVGASLVVARRGPSKAA